MAWAQKKAKREGRLIIFIDESGLSERPTRVRTWAPKGQLNFPVLTFQVPQPVAVRHVNANPASAWPGHCVASRMGG